MEKRGLIDQGRKEQHSADLEQEVKDASQAAKVQGDVQRESDADVDSQLEQLRKSAGGK